MNKESLSAFKSNSSEDLFYYFKHDGAINFEKKMMAGSILKDRGYDQKTLSKEKKIIEDSIRAQLKESENKEGIKKRAVKKMNRKFLFGLGYFTFFLLLGLKDYWYQQEDIDWLYFSIMLSLGLLFIIYHFVTYQKKLDQIIKDELENNELLKNRLKLIEENWLF